MASAAKTDETAPLLEKDPDVDTSLFAWWMVTIATLILIFAFSILYSFGVYLTCIEDEFGESRALVSWIGSAQFFCLYFASFFVGQAVEKFGPRIVTTFAGILIVSGSIAASYAGQIWMLHIFWGALTGTGIAGAYLPALSVTVTWFKKRRGLAIGVVAAGSGAGNFIAPYATQLLIDSIGWRATMRYVGITCGVGVLICGLALKFRVYISPPEGTLRPALKRPYFRWMLAFGFTGALGFSNPIIHIPAYSEEMGISGDNGALLLSMMGAAQIVGRIGNGWIADWFGATKSLFIAVLLLGVLAVMWAYVFTNFGLILLFVLLYGFNVGAVYALPTAMIGEYFKGINPSGIVGVFFSVFCIPGMLGPVLTGFIFDKTNSYQLASVFTGVPLLIASIILYKMILILKEEGSIRPPSKTTMVDPISNV